MATVPISALPAGGSATGADLLASVQGGVTVKITENTVNTFVKQNIVTPANGGILYTDASQVQLLAPTATNKQILLSGASSSPSWSSCTFPDTTTINQLLYSSSNNTIAGLSTANRSVLVTNTSGVPLYSSSLTDGQLIIGSTSGTPAAANLTAGTNISIVNSANGITINCTGGAVTNVLSATGTANQVLVNGTSGSAETGAITLTLPQSIGTSNTPTFTGLILSSLTPDSLLVAGLSGAISQISGVNRAVLVTNTAGVPIYSSAMTDGQLIIGSTGNTPTAANLTGDSIISIANGAASIAFSFVNTAVTTLSNLVTIGTITSGTWNGSIISGQFGGTGISNSGKTITLGGNLTTSGSFNAVFTLTGDTNVTFPTTGTLATTAGSVSSNTGTANQVLVNSTSGIAQTGACTFTLPQSIATSSSPTFSQLTLSTLTEGSVLFVGTSGLLSQDNANFFWTDSTNQLSIGTSTPNSSAILTLSSTTRGFLPPVMNTTQRNAIGTPATGLTIYNSTNSDLETYNGTLWVGSSASGVTSIIGTANQVLANGTSGSSQTGAVTLTLPQSIATSSTVRFAALGLGVSALNILDVNGAIAIGSALAGISSAPSNGALIEGQVVIGTSAGAAKLTTFSGALGTTAGNQNEMGNFIVSDTNGSIVRIFANRRSNGSDWTTDDLYIQRRVDVTDKAFLKFVGGSSDLAFGAGTTEYVRIVDSVGGMAIGSTFAGISTPPIGGAILSGPIAAGIATTSSARIRSFMGSSDIFGLLIDGGTSQAGTNLVGLGMYASMLVSSNSFNGYGIASQPTFDLTNNAGSLLGIYVNVSTANTGTATIAYSIYVGEGTIASGTPTITTFENVHIDAPVIGTNRTSLRVEQPSGGSTNFTASLEGTTLIGRSTAIDTNILSVESGLGVIARSDGFSLTTINQTANPEIIRHISTNSTGISGSALQLIHTRGTYASPTATQNGDVLGIIDFGGFTNALYAPGIALLALAAETWSASAAGSDLYFYTTKTGATSNSESLRLSANGNVVCAGNNAAAIATNATDGFLYLPSCNGTPTGTPTSYTGRIAFVYDTSANKIWAYNGSWRGILVV